MADINNPAARLHKILSDARALNENSQAKDVWTKVLGSDPGSLEDLLRRYVELLQTCDAIQHEIAHLQDVNSKLHLKYFGQVRAALGVCVMGANLASDRGLDADS